MCMKNEKMAKFKISKFLKITQHARHTLKVADKMCKYDMDPEVIVKDAERKRFPLETDGQTDRQTDGYLFY